ncbi:2-dehydropantoate 2-reductase [Neorhizobium sp. T786]|uniref:2-dehydropantoate 2-reductase n=1 Tax=Pseudorhizobium xiangyangii TaxID=2883104 RepID=UPI001CFFBFAF|nr:2-dehydropantoate 2-reductase [Neorhizobium xiangyangii]MCB5204111.1 2-dehydropantoate 2-reductase [Neorhizobium xiangyangii]
MGQSKVAVVGLGGIGGVAAACLSLSADNEVTVCARRPIDALTFDHKDDSVSIPLRTLTDPQQAEPVDWVLLCTKAQDTASAAPWLSRLCGPETAIAVLQNGIGHTERVAPFVRGAAVLPAIVYYNGERLAPDHIRLRKIVGHDLLVPSGPLADAFTALFEGTPIEVGRSDSFLTLQWRKLLINVIANPVTALTRQRLGVFHRADIQELSLGILREAVSVGRAEGAELAEDEADTILATFLGYPAEAGTSMYFDCIAGRPLEIEALNGAVVAAGRRHGIATPLNGAMLALLNTVSDANAAAFEQP